MVWCVVKPKYPYLPAGEIESEFEKSIDIEKLKVSSGEKERMHAMIQFIKDQCTKTRAGIIDCALEALKITLRNQKVVNGDTFFTVFMNDLINSVETRKLTAFETAEGIAANIQLLSGAHFDPKYDEDMPSISNDSGFIDHHFAYLKTPIEDSLFKNHFLLFRPMASSKLCSKPSSDYNYKVQCYFDEGEELLKMVCLLADIEIPLRTFFTKTSNHIRKSEQLSSLKNLAFSAILDSSHYADSEKEVCFQGLGFENFLRNLLHNLTDNEN